MTPHPDPAPELGAFDCTPLVEAARVARGWDCQAAGTDYQTSGNGRFWDGGTDYAQGRIDASAEILSLIPKEPPQPVEKEHG